MIPNLKLVIGGVLLVIILSLFGYARWEHSRYVETKADYDTFIIKAQVLAAERLAENARKEKEYAENIRLAESDRNIAVAKLRDNQKRADLSRLPFLPASTENRVCLNRTQFESAIGDLVADLQEIAGTGDLALIDLQTFISSWPK